MNSPPPNKQPEVERHWGWYCLAFLDIVGQSAELQKLLALANDDEEAIKKALSKTAGYILDLRQKMHDFFHHSQAIEAVTSDLSPEVRDQITKANNAVKFYGFSDSFVMAIRFEGAQDQFVSMNGVYRCLIASCMLQLIALNYEGPIRGGIEVQRAINLTENEVYGPVSYRAYHLERQVAEYSRVLIGDGVLRYLDWIEGQPTTTKLGKISKLLVSKAKELIVFDFDGFPMLNFLGKAMFDLWPAEGRQKMFAKAYDYAKQKQQTAKSAEDYKMLSRYNRLCSYFDRHAAMWNQTG